MYGTIQVRVFLAFTLFLILSPACTHEPVGIEDDSIAVPSEPPGFQVRRGTNISHWLSQSRRRGEERKQFFTRKDAELLAELGFDHLRIPIDEEQMWDEEGNREAEAFELLDSALDWCQELNLRVIVDLHILRSHHFNEGEKPLWTDPAAQERLAYFWRDLSALMKSRPVDMVAYELMNEPVADDPEDWNRLVAELVSVLRGLEPDRMIVIGSNRWQTVDTFDRLKVPEGDPNILLSFHFYTPMPLTHYKASWTKVGEYQGPVNYPGIVVADRDLEGLPEALLEAIGGTREYNKQILEKLLAKPLSLSEKTGLSLYCGEWGCLPTVPREARLQWYRDHRANLEENGISWATWDYKGSFGIFDEEGNVDREFVDVLLR